MERGALRDGRGGGGAAKVRLPEIIAATITIIE
jgi:hypothetical protein